MSQFQKKVCHNDKTAILTFTKKNIQYNRKGNVLQALLGRARREAAVKSLFSWAYWLKCQPVRTSYDLYQGGNSENRLLTPSTLNRHWKQYCIT